MQKIPISEEQAISQAADFLESRGCEFVRETGKISKKLPEGYKVVFFIPAAFDPECVVDPPDIWALVSYDGKQSELMVHF